MDEEVKKKIESAVSQSGFPLEHYIGNVLRKHDWRIISNRYYIDDLKNVEREIDILAYKTYTDEDEMIQYYTSLIVSCKKSDKYTWCFLTRKSDTMDCNVDWTPLHFYTSDVRLKYMTEKHRDFLINKYKTHNAIKNLYDFPESVFAYQQLAVVENTRHGRMQGDYYIDGNDDIYNSIITSIKALETEKRSRTENTNNKRYKKYYMFHLVSIFDGAMVKDCFDDNGNQQIEPIQEIKYLNRHIVNKVDNFYIVNFTTKENFEYRLKLWDYFHSYNSLLLTKVVSEFYKDIFSEKDKADILWNNFKELTLWRIGYFLRKFNKTIPVDNLDISYSYCNDKLELELATNHYLDESIIDRLNNETELIGFIQKNLLEIYRYKGVFCFSNGLPF